eukprot:5193109-Prymnesium_polylepis.1
MAGAARRAADCIDCPDCPDCPDCIDCIDCIDCTDDRWQITTEMRSVAVVASRLGEKVRRSRLIARLRDCSIA